jgi:hypothetical protein
MAPTLITSDLSLTDNPRDEYRWEFLEKTLPTFLRVEGARMLYVLGDLTEEKDNHGSWLVNRLCDAFYKLAQLADVAILRGNHDYQGSGFPFFSFLDMLESITFISEPMSIPGTLFLPHTTNYIRDWEPWKDTLRNYPLVFAHNTFQGAFANGVAIPGIPPSYFPSSTLIIAGDIHTPQTHGKVTYVGAPYTVDFGDDYKPRVLVIHEDPFRFESVPVPGVQKWLLTVDANGDWKMGRGALPVGRGIVKVRVLLERGDYAKWPEIRDRVRAMMEEKGLIVHAVEPVVQKQDKTSAASKSKRKTESDEELLNRYAKIHGIDEKTVKTGLEML